jgi:hypothetical protein
VYVFNYSMVTLDVAVLVMTNVQTRK